MTYCELVQQAYDSGLIVKEMNLRGRFKGLCFGNRVAIEQSMGTNEKKCILAEEIGHCYLTVGDILDQSKVENVKQERRARAWAYEKIVPIENIRFAIQDGYHEVWEIAEYLEVSESFLIEAIEYYKAKGYLFGVMEE